VVIRDRALHGAIAHFLQGGKLLGIKHVGTKKINGVSILSSSQYEAPDVMINPGME
jgi:hypothetical protein